MPITIEQVQRCYITILRREPSPAEIRRWSGGSSNDRSYSIMMETLITQATEVRSIARSYLGLLGRLPESLTEPDAHTDGFIYWIGVLRSFRAEHASIPYREALTYLIDEWLQEPELLTRFAVESPAGYVARLCEAVLDRLPVPEEAVSWAQIAANPERGRAKLAVTLLESAECKERFNETINKKMCDQATRP